MDGFSYEIMDEEVLHEPVEERVVSSMQDNTEVLRDEQNFIRSVSQFYNSEALSDVEIRICDQKFHSHRFVLATLSDVFRTMLYDENWTQSKERTIVLKESEICQVVFDHFLKFFYTAEITVTLETAVGILCLADKYNVASLKSLCMGYMVKHSKSPQVQNALSWYSWAKALNLPELINQCTKTISWNIRAVLNSDEWVSMDSDFVYDILSNSELVILNEFFLYEALVKWLYIESNYENLQDNATRLLPLIRFPQMMVWHLNYIEKNDLIQKEECKEILKELVSKAYRFRSLCMSQALLGVSFQDKFYLPRNYLELAVDAVRMQNTHRFAFQVDVETYAGPVPSETREGNWKITYHKNPDSCNWSLQFYCYEMATIKGEALVQASILIFNHANKVIQLEMVDSYDCTKSRHLAITVSINNPDDSKLMVVLIKPVPH
ncbi:hypothetical protein CHS0354_028219 [Potamilus streckersoni]|uniref:BTB domain-containing protein n=1 Tax=Potamilus streckersoni TaxID=2493646 RepID=A0AAE0T6Y1_9BIVA|nr:hypothetical protein CHS0354_028219 [Potamilus streckersoni]